MGIRSFIAILPGPQLQARLAELSRDLASELSGDRVRVSWVAEPLLHLTLRFLGDVEPERLDELGSSLVELTRSEAPFESLIAGLGFLPSPARPRVIYAGMQAARLAPLAAAVEARVRGLGFAPEERPFRAHITLGRIKDGRLQRETVERMSALGQKMGALPFPVSELILFRSDLRPEGPRYTPLSRAPLAGG